MPPPELAIHRVRRGIAVVAIAVPLGWLGLWLAARGQLIPGVVAVLIGLGGLAWGIVTVLASGRAQTAALSRALTVGAERGRELEWLQGVARALVSGEDLDQVLQEVVKTAAELLHAQGATIGLVVEEGRFVRLVAGAGPLAPAIGQLVPADGSLLGWVVTHERPLTAPDMAADPRNYPVEGLPLRSMAAVPLRSAGVVIGVLAVLDHAEARPFGESDTRLLEALSDQVAVGLDRVHVLEESRHKEEVLAAKNRELQRATELKSQFLANISHELRTPLNAINGFSELMLTGELGDLSQVQREFLDAILRNGKHLLGLISSVLDLSKIEAGRMSLELSQTDLHTLILSTVADTAPLRSAKHQECRLEIGADPLMALADEQRVRQILFNLLSNASKFTPEGGVVAVSALATRAPVLQPADGPGEPRRMVGRDVLWVSIRDTGPGIRPEDLPRLFHEFSQVDSSPSRQQQGTGLGLALSRRFVEMHGGAIGCESVRGSGSTFWFTLPVEGPGRQ
jgi:signal transduction histidine kinase